MDVPNLHPLPPARANTPVKDSQREFPASQPAASESTAPEGREFDRIERSQELSQQIEQIRQKLNEAPELSEQKIREIREQLSQAREHTHELILQAAAGILSGELFFARDPSA